MTEPIRLTRRRAIPKGNRQLGKAEEEMASLAWGIAHPARVAIIRLLLERGDCICGAIVNALPLAQATVSQHLKVLKETGWIKGEIDGPRVCYCPAAGASERFAVMLRELHSRERR